ncbi:hypothetical protein [Mesorhizobium sp. CN2-181]|uniref:hypothetical protein n=1 Tax=Mesorhizobium yinganensis TaxID=3157707 RepID=UPI0032B76276
MQAGDWVSGEVRRLLVKRLVKEAGISEARASELIDMLGPDWSSLIREARNLQRGA